MEFELSESEAQRYDRQIRVWGAEAQSRIQNSRVLVSGLGKMNPEVIKNIVLAGMNVTLQSTREATYDDLSHNFFLTVDDVGRPLVTAMLPKVQELNNFAKVVAEHSSLETLPDEYFEGFSVILLTECSESQAVRINNICRKRNTECAFFWSDMYGEEGIFYSDFGPEFSYKEDKQPSNSSANGSAEAANKDSAAKVKSLNFPALETVLNRRWSKVVSRHFPLSKTFVRHRLLVQFREQHGQEPSSSDAELLRQLLADLQARNGLPTQPTVLDDAQLQRLGRVAGTASVLACSVLGSYLSQEVVKAVSHSGEPAFNVFVFSGEDLEAKAFPVR